MVSVTKQPVQMEYVPVVSDRKYWCDEQGLTLISEALIGIEGALSWSGAVPKEYRAELSEVKGKLERFLSNGIFSDGC